ncbi:MAG TPA: hypothetical protein VGM08_01745 [Candidatus Saccharimonadales bacterium]|jgi:hypothetical protein
MPAQAGGTTYEQTVSITNAYLGPAAGRFVDRQVRNHLHKEPADMTRSDLSRLIDWIRIAVSFLTDDTRIVDEYIGQLKELAHAAPSAKPRIHHQD